MSISVDARVRAVPNFLVCLSAAREFMHAQDAETPPARFKKLQHELARARELLSFAPSSGRPARFLAARSGWGRFQAEQATQLATALGMADLREFILARHILLYAHSEREVVLLAPRRERELGYGMAE